MAELPLGNDRSRPCQCKCEPICSPFGVASQQTILEAGLSAGIAMDYSCAMGGCGACTVRLCDGEVEMEEPNCLTTAERAGGYVLACVSRVRTPVTIALEGAS